jgi:hypothetical protein
MGMTNWGDLLRKSRNLASVAFIKLDEDDVAEQPVHA